MAQSAQSSHGLNFGKALPGQLQKDQICLGALCGGGSGRLAIFVKRWRDIR
ncbi:hypothetical protein MnTg02_02735 [bacterium MnTg02]|nr:hypothetical protein MnTg02_02735 [bacterium MnTg02]